MPRRAPSTEQRLASLARECKRYGYRLVLRYDPEAEPYAKWRLYIRRPDGSKVWDVRAGSAPHAIGRMEFFLSVAPHRMYELA